MKSLENILFFTSDLAGRKRREDKSALISSLYVVRPCLREDVNFN
jgi:hypothetical protein